jgi:hypothetical protein
MGGYILLRIPQGFNDGIFLLKQLMPYALKHNRTIIWSLLLYGLTDLDSIFDFSNFPVKVLCGEKHLKDILYSSIEPACYENKLDGHNIEQHWDDCPNYYTINGQLTEFDQTKEYNDSVLLVYHNSNGGITSFDNIKFKSPFIEKFYIQRNLFDKFVAIHLRATDYPGYNEEEDTAKVDDFIKKHPDIPVYIASDNSMLVEKLCQIHKQLVKPLSYKKITEKYRSLHHTFGNTDPECLTNALIDILMCASADDFLRSRGGFSRLIWNLSQNKELLQTLTCVKESAVLQTSDSSAEVLSQNLTSAEVDPPAVLQTSDSSAEV